MLRRLVEDDHVAGWDDPRMPTISALRRRGYTPNPIRDMCERVGIARRNTVTELALLEYCLREDLNLRAPRRMAVLNPLKLVITNYPEDQSELFEAINNPEDESMGVRQVPFSREIYIERDDFMEDPPRRFYRLAPGREVRLRYACLITCTDVIKDADGNVTEVHCTYDPDSRGGNAPDGRRVQGTIHWVSAAHAAPLEVRVYDNLFTDPSPASAADDAGQDFTDLISPDSLRIVNAWAEPALADASPGDRYQFERLGYFVPTFEIPNPEPGVQPHRNPARQLGPHQPTGHQSVTRRCCTSLRHSSLGPGGTNVSDTVASAMLPAPPATRISETFAPPCSTGFRPQQRGKLRRQGRRHRPESYYGRRG